MSETTLKRRRNAYKARAVKLKKEIEELLSQDERSYAMEHKCQQLRDQLETIKEVSESICDILETDEKAADFMEDTYEFTDACDDLLATASKKSSLAAEKMKKMMSAK